MMMYEKELEELEKKYAYKREEHSSYDEGLPMKKPAGSSRFLGSLSMYGSYYIDEASKKLLREKLS